MFVIVYNNYVNLGPMPWNKRRFESFIQEEYEIEVVLPSTAPTEAIVVDPNILSIYPVGDSEPLPEFNPKIQFLQGPYWNYSTGLAVSHYVAEDLSIDAVKNQLKAEVTTERYNREVAGVQATTQGTTVTVDTSRGNRDVFVQKYLLMGENDTVTWKFPEAWLILTKAELGALVAIGAGHVQDQFEWEALKLAEIDSKATLAELDAVVIKEVT